MDPNATLKEIREIVNTPEAEQADLDRIKELFQALDRWLSNGGFPPGDWIKSIIIQTLKAMARSKQ